MPVCLFVCLGGLHYFVFYCIFTNNFLLKFAMGVYIKHPTNKARKLVGPLDFLSTPSAPLKRGTYEVQPMITVSNCKNSSVENVDGDRGRLGRSRLAGVESGVAVLDAADDQAGHEPAERVAKKKVAFGSLRALEQYYLEAKEDAFI